MGVRPVRRRWKWLMAQMPWHTPETLLTREGWSVCPCGRYGFETNRAEIERLESLVAEQHQRIARLLGEKEGE